MKRETTTRGFALVITLVLMALIVIVVVAYLGNTRSDRSTSSTYANRLRAKMVADAGLTAATTLLYENTKTGNYITAMPAPLPSPAPLRTELYRPDSAAIPDDFLQLNNAIGEVLASRAGTSPLAAPTPQVDPRPSATPMTAPTTGGSFGLVEPNPTPSSADSYDFNQVMRVGSTDLGRLVNPTTPVQPAFGQWIRVRNAAGELIGRYAFFIEDESMKTNVNVAGNQLGATIGPNPPPDLRINDLAPLPASTPARQVEEIDPSGSLPAAAPRPSAGKALAALGPSGARLPTKTTIGLLSDWDGSGGTKLSDYAHTLTTLSKDDVTTARGWQRMDLNAVVKSNPPKVAAQMIADWIKDAWTGPTQIGSLAGYQVYGDDRLRLQVAANIVDYIDTDRIPTDMGTYPAGDPNGLPVIGIEKIPYLVEFDVVYTASDATPPVPGTANIGIRFRFNFFNMFETDLKLSDYIGSVRIKGVPVVIKNNSPVFDVENQTFTVAVGAAGIPDGVVPWGGDGVTYGVAGVKTFNTPQITSQALSYSPGGAATRFEAGAIQIDVLGKNGELLDSTRIVTRDLPAKYSNASPQPNPNDFLEARQSAASINATYEATTSPSGAINTLTFGDPRYRPSPIQKRWYNVTRTDTTRFSPGSAQSGDDKAEQDSRADSIDWYDYSGNRPFLAHRDGPMLNVGELGNVSACEYAWRTIYLQYAGRPENTTDADVIPNVQDRRGSRPGQTSSQLPTDYVLMDLFKTSALNTRSGSVNINTQFNLANAAGLLEQGPLASLFLNIPVHEDSSAGTKAPVLLGNSAVAQLVTGVAGRRVASDVLATGGPAAWGGATLPVDNNPRRPFFTLGELASVMSRFINQNATTVRAATGDPSQSRTGILYSVVRSAYSPPANPTTENQSNNIQRDSQVEQPFRAVSNSITTRGNVFRVLYVGQTIKDINKDGKVQTVQDDPSYTGPSEKLAEYLGEAYIEREAIFGAPTTVGASSVKKTTDSKFKIVAQRALTE